jgi:hypothetical protein
MYSLVLLETNTTISASSVRFSMNHPLHNSVCSLCFHPKKTRNATKFRPSANYASKMAAYCGVSLLFSDSICLQCAATTGSLGKKTVSTNLQTALYVFSLVNLFWTRCTTFPDSRCPACARILYMRQKGRRANQIQSYKDKATAWLEIVSTDYDNVAVIRGNYSYNLEILYCHFHFIFG